MAELKPVRQASFRGVPFKVFTTETAFGRRLVEHTFVKRDTPYQEDLGRSPREFRVEAFVIGTDYATQRDALITAAEVEGPGQLIHPFYGTKKVSIKSFRVREAAGERGMARIDIEFVEAGELTFPKSVNDPTSKLADTVETFRSRAATDFLNKFDVANKAQFIVDSAQAKVEGVADSIGEQTKKYTTVSSSVTDLAFSIRNLRTDAADLLNTPETLQTRLSASIADLTNSFGLKRDSTKMYSGFFGYGASDPMVVTDTVNRRQETTNSGAINSLISREALAQAALDASEIEFASTEDADDIREMLFNEIDDQQNDTDDDEIYASLLELKARIGEAIPPTTEQLPSIVTLELPASIPSIVLAYDLYEALDREQDLIDRNHVSHPAFIPGGVELKVLNDV